MRTFSLPMGRRNDGNGVDWAVVYRSRHGAYIRGLREALGLRQEDVTNSLKLHPTMLSQIECGRTALPPDWYLPLAEILKVDLKEFCRIALRYSNPWAYYALIDDKDKELNAELALMSPRYFNPKPKPKQSGA